MATRKMDRISANLCKKGFVRKKTHHVYYELLINGRRTNISTYASHGSNEVDDHLIRAMAKQLKMKKEDFLKFIDCTMTQEEYIHLLVVGNKLTIKES